MANLADIVVDETSESPAGNSERARQALTEVVTGEPTTGSEPPAGTTNVDPLDTELGGEAVPEKFRGKRLRDVLESYGNLESRLGTMSNELGVQRQLTDRLLDLKRNDDLKRNTPPVERKPTQVTASEILDKPAETLDRVLNEREAAITAEVNRRLAGIQMSIAEQNFRSKHPTFQATVNDPAFGEWLRASPIRLRAAAAANNGDWQIADELFSEYERGKSSTSTSTASVKQTDNLEAARKATLESSTGGGAEQGVKKAKTYSRADLMRLRIDDPEAYYDDTFQAEILQAYREGRVK